MNVQEWLKSEKGEDPFVLAFSPPNPSRPGLRKEDSLQTRQRRK